MRRFIFIAIVTGLGAAAVAQNLLEKPSAKPFSINEEPPAESPGGNLLQSMPAGPEESDDAFGLQLGTSAKTGVVDIATSVPGMASESAEVTEEAAEEMAVTRRSSFLMNVGLQYSGEGEYGAAEQAYLSALKEDPDNIDLQFRLSTLYILMERYEEAEALLKKMAAAYPDNALVHNNLAWIYSTGDKLRNGKLALLHAREALLSAPMAPSIWNTLAEAYYLNGDYDKALRSSRVALEQLQRGKPSEDEIRSFQAQQMKIVRAAEAEKILEGLDDE